MSLYSSRARGGSGGQSVGPKCRGARPGCSIRNMRSEWMEPRFGRLKESDWRGSLIIRNTLRIFRKLRCARWKAYDDKMWSKIRKVSIRGNRAASP